MLSEKLSIESIIKPLEKILGKEYVLVSQEDRFCYASDATANDDVLHIPDIVVLPENTQQVSEILKLAYENNIPVVTRGAGTNLCGGCIPLKGGIVIHTSRMKKLEIDKDNMICTVQPGVVVGNLQKEVENLGLFYPPDPSCLKASTIGGSLALSSSGPRTFKYGGTKDYVLGLEVVLADGRIIRTGGQTIKNVTGYNLTQLFVGSEGTLGVITEATLRLIPKPEESQVVLAFFDSVDSAAEAVTGIIKSKVTPATLDLLDQNTMATIEKFYPTGLPLDMDAALVIEVDGFKHILDFQINQIVEICKSFGAQKIRASQNEKEREEIWMARRSAFAAVAKLKPDVVTEDAVVPRCKIPDLIRETKRLAKKHGITVCIMGHAGDGNIHPNIPVDFRNKEEVEKLHKFTDEFFDAAIALGGTLSGEHGIGLSKAKYIEKALDPVAISYMKAMKELFDPKGILNPGKIF